MHKTIRARGKKIKALREGWPYDIPVQIYTLLTAQVIYSCN